MSKLARRSLFQGIAGVLLSRVAAPEPVKEAVVAVSREIDNLWARADGLKLMATVQAAAYFIYKGQK